MESIKKAARQYIQALYIYCNETQNYSIYESISFEEMTDRLICYPSTKNLVIPLKETLKSRTQSADQIKELIFEFLRDVLSDRQDNPGEGLSFNTLLVLMAKFL